MIETSRRKFITGLSTLIVAPAIVRVESLMPVRNLDNLKIMTLEDYSKYILEPMIKRLDVLYDFKHIRPDWTTLI